MGQASKEAGVRVKVNLVDRLNFSVIILGDGFEDRSVSSVTRRDFHGIH